MSIRRLRRSEDESYLLPDQDIMESGDDRGPPNSRIAGDRKNVAVLFFLYLLQGIPLGLMQAMPVILARNGVNYRQQAQFSFVNWPFSLKLLWAPIVDSIFLSRMGKRKSWLVPCQYLIGIVMLFLSYSINNLIGLDGTTEPSMLLLVAAFFTLNFLAATQDIVVDGWALTMLKRENVGYASTCNSVGQTAGYLLSYVAFVTLESASFCNSFFRNEPEETGMVTVSGFIHFWGWVFIVTTSLVWWLKSERPPRGIDEPLNVRDTYKMLVSILKLKPIQLLAVVLLTAKFPFSAVDSITGLKFIESGVPQEKLALMAAPLVPLQILLPLLISRRTAGAYPMEIYVASYPVRLFFSLLLAGYVWITPNFIENGNVSVYFFVFLLIIYAIHQVSLYSMFVSQMAFFAKISDPAVGGTYMTLVNTLANLGGNWTSTVALWLVDLLTIRECSTDSENVCSSKQDKKACSDSGGTCDVQFDGYYLEVFICTVSGLIWLAWGRKAIRKLQSYPLEYFTVPSRSR